MLCAFFIGIVCLQNKNYVIINSICCHFAILFLLKNTKKDILKTVGKTIDPG